ncbi:oxygen-independent coproporphyrinogen-3 oxidase [Desulfofustis glycolicus DSM 9705]|uniref:Heme chaperone HemW n=2 Tax=Desulfofustis glycolicus TaxID=51195 RepID=A0A1M5WJN7_9BACT|nr:oxygen-independent coproporphyrinogen-3 oxidase [Desulfofustis glycolicus DSM 9705]
MTPAALRRTLSTLFIGGGTPTVLDDLLLHQILTACADVFGFADDAEITLESNPESLVERDLDELRRYGVNRLSIGVQSFNTEELALLGRVHDAHQAERAVQVARRSGIDTISLDMMYGLPGQTTASWRDSLSRAIECSPEHLSIYQLSIDDKTPFFRLHRRGELHLPDEDQILAMDDITMELCTLAGFEQYEVSNFRQPGCGCRHNLVYWRNEEYLGCGAAAVSYLNGERCGRIADPRSYCELIEAGTSPVFSRERLDRQASFRETVIMGLRLNEGISDDRLDQRFGCRLQDIYGAELDTLSADGLLYRDGVRWRLTTRGRKLANVVMRELV